MNFIQTNPGELTVPKDSVAQYEVIIRNTGAVFYTDSYDTTGSKIQLAGYWESVGSKYKYRDRAMTLDTAVFGEIKVRRR